MRRSRILLLTIFVLVALVGFGQTAMASPPPASAQLRVTAWRFGDRWEDRREVRHDLRELRQDRRELRQDRRELRRDFRTGHYAAARAERHELRQDRRELRHDRRALRRDLRELRRDRRYGLL